MQSESGDCIKEALQILKHGTPIGIQSFSWPTILRQKLGLWRHFSQVLLFTSVIVIESRPWERWVCDKKSSEGAEWLFDQLCASAWAPSANPSSKEPQDYHFKQATDALKSSKLWKKNKHVRTWLSNTWLNTSEVVQGNKYAESWLGLRKICLA